MSKIPMASTGKKMPEAKQAGQRSISAFFAAVPKKEGVKRHIGEWEEPLAKRRKAATAKSLAKPFEKPEVAETPTPSRRSGKQTSTPGKRSKPVTPFQNVKQIPDAPKNTATGAAGAKQQSASILRSSPCSEGRQTEPLAANRRPVGAQHGKELIGKRVKLYWPSEEDWFTGQITAINAKGRHHVAYDDGDEEWVNLQEEKWELLGSPDEPLEGRRRSLIRKSAQLVVSSPGSDSPDDSEESDFEAGEESDEGEDEDGEDEGEVDSDEEDNVPAAKKPQSQAAKKRTKASHNPCKTPADSRAAGAASAMPECVAKSKSGQQVLSSTAQKGALTAALAPKTPATDASAGFEPLKSSSLAAADSERYAARAAEKFPFLHPDKIKDASGKRPGEHGYNPRTLYIPPNWFKAAKISEGQRQWWEFKAQHFDSVLLFKMGKFYEMFEMDAHTGADVLGLIYMKGEQPHCGFPEANYHQHAERLARAGLRVVVVEQTETPDQLRVRNEQRRAAGKTKVGVVNREMVAVLTQGTLTDPEMLYSHLDASYVYCLTELAAATARDQPCFGACAVDCATGQMLIGSWIDDEMRTNLRSQLAALRPVEVVIPSEGLSALTRKVLLSTLRRPRVNQLIPGTQFWSAATTLKELSEAGYFRGGVEDCSWPKVLQELQSEGQGGKAGLSAFGGAVSFLRSVLLDRCVVGLGRVERMQQATWAASGGPASLNKSPEILALDGSALENLEVLETTSGSTSGTLLYTLDACATPAGRRKLKDWLCRPLGRVHDILARQDAVQELMTDASDAASAARRTFSSVGDLERSIARLCASSLGGFGRDNSSVVLYEDAAKRKVAAFLAALQGLQKLQEAMQGFQEMGASLSSVVLQELTSPGQRLPDLGCHLKELLEAADWENATSQGRIVPNQGVDEEFDRAVEGLAAVEEHLQEYLDNVKVLLKGKSVSYVSLNKESHVLEVPEELTKYVPGSFELVSQKKGCKRYMTPQLRDFLKKRGEAVQQKEEAMAGILQGMVNRFAEQQQVWNGAVAAMAELDALMSLAAAAEQAAAWGPVCRPTFQPSDDDAPQVFKAVALRHPAASMNTSNFVPNDIQLSDPQRFIILTGPNMGGKSTLIRQVCLAALLAHVGALVPAESLQLTPVDAIFVRMGARDSIAAGQSTFFVELTETASALNRATCRSLVALDELGRGTSTSDGAAIASAVLQHLSATSCCRGLFATHYHKLAEAHGSDANVAIKHMACHVKPSSGPDEVTFLYKLASGACPKSYGTNVAQLAGIPGPIVARAASFAAQLEERSQTTAEVAPFAVKHKLELEEEIKFQRLCKALCSGGNLEGVVAKLQSVQQSLIC